MSLSSVREAAITRVPAKHTQADGTGFSVLHLDMEPGSQFSLPATQCTEKAQPTFVVEGLVNGGSGTNYGRGGGVAGREADVDESQE